MRAVWGMIGAAYLLAVPAASAQYTINDVDCSGLKLVAASGVPKEPTHSYKFHGFCSMTQISSVKEEIAGIHYDDRTSVEVLAKVWVDLAASWNSQTGYFKEQAKTQGSYAGQVEMELRCTADPVLWGAGTFYSKPPCQAVAYLNTTGWNGFDRVYAVPRPISQRKTTLDEASELSQQQATTTGSNPPPPPPPAPSLTPTSPSPTITRATVPTGTEPLTPVPPQIVVSPTRSTPSPTPPPASEPAGEIALAPEMQVELEDGRVIVADQKEGPLRWAIMGSQGELLRRFPPGSKLTEKKHNLTIQWPGGSYQAGKRADKAKEK